MPRTAVLIGDICVNMEWRAQPGRDWSAIRLPWRLGDPVGYGQSQEAAIADLAGVRGEDQPNPLKCRPV